MMLPRMRTYHQPCLAWSRIALNSLLPIPTNWIFNTAYSIKNFFVCQVGLRCFPRNGTGISHGRKYVTVRGVVKETRTISRAKAMHRRGFRSNGNAGNKKNGYLGLKASAAAYCSTRIGGGAAVSTATRRNTPKSFGCTNLIHSHLEMF